VHAASAHVSARATTRRRRRVMSDRTAYGTTPG
jgi:hypothetical protein